MTTIRTTVTNPNAQVMRREASLVRPADAEPARAFLEVLGDLERPPAEPAKAGPASDEAETPEPKADRPDGPEPDAPEPDTAEEAPDVPVPVVIDPDRPPTQVAKVNQELKHAAVVDLAELASDEMLAPGPKHPGKHGGWSDEPLSTPPPALTASKPPPTGEPGPTHQAGPDASVAVDAKPRPPQEPIPLRPGIEPSVVDAESVSAEPAKAQAVRAAAPPVKAEPEHAAVGAGGRLALLTRLTGSAEAARGAIGAVDRAGSQPVNRESVAMQGPVRPASAQALREQAIGQMQRGLASMLVQGGGRMTVVLRPEQLGEVRVRMETRDGVVKARLTASTEAARQTLESGLDALRASLEARGVRVEALDIEGPPAPDAGRTDPDGRGGSGSGGEGGGGAFRDPSREWEPELSPEPVVGRIVWTELGIDAVA